MSKRSWSSKLAFIWAATGAAVGLGAIWKFPYMAGIYGGGTFVLAYIALMFIFGMPIMLAEVSLGRLGQGDAVTSLRHLSQKYHLYPFWSLIGWLGMLALLLILSFYSVVAGWTLGYSWKAFTGDLSIITAQTSSAYWYRFLSEPVTLIGYQTLFLAITLAVVQRGSRGIEFISNFMVPGLLLMMLGLISYGVIEGDFERTVHFLLMPHWEHFNKTVILNALGQAFFSLAIGAGCMLIYGSYLPDNKKVILSVTSVVCLTAIVTILAGFAIFPILFAHGLPASSGPGLIFQTVPIAFNQISGGYFISIIFFALLIIAALTSSLSLAEPLVAFLFRRGWQRYQACWLIGGLCLILGGLANLSFNELSHITLQGKIIFVVLTDISTNILLPLGGLGFALFIGWGLPKEAMHPFVKPRYLFTIWYFLIRYFVPLAILWLLWGS